MSRINCNLYENYHHVYLLLRNIVLEFIMFGGTWYNLNKQLLTDIYNLSSRNIHSFLPHTKLSYIFLCALLRAHQWDFDLSGIQQLLLEELKAQPNLI